ncbi:ATP phosphoribosyltransferase [archaeon]|nr:ATP phosphoribosyltransferase [archaeon]
MNEKLKMYIPSGNLEKFVLEIMDGSGFEPEKPDRGYVINTNSNVWDFKQIKTRDQPYMVAGGMGDLCVVGEDILKEFQLGYPHLSDNLEILEYFEGRPTKLVAVVLVDKYQAVNSLSEFFESVGDDARIAAEYPNIAKEYVLKNFGLDVDVYKPSGKTEATLIGGRSEMDLIIDTMETGNTIKANGGKIIDTLMDSKQVVVVNKLAYGVSDKKSEIDNLLEQFNGVMRARQKILRKLQVNVFEEEDVSKVVDYLVDEGFRPTVSKLYPYGADVYVVLPDGDIKSVCPKLNVLGGSDMVVTKIERVIYPTE